MRNRLKVAATVQNARAFLDTQAEYGRFSDYIWRFVDGRPIVNARRNMKAVPAKTRASDAMSQDLKARGFKFVGSTICHVFMQAVGMVNDHTVDCFHYRKLAR